jgi:hypothetical protein
LNQNKATLKTAETIREEQVKAFKEDEVRGLVVALDNEIWQDGKAMSKTTHIYILYNLLIRWNLDSTHKNDRIRDGLLLLY